MNKKILIIRFSSIGDIVLTTPVVRALKLQLPGVEIHYAVKEKFRQVLGANPYIHAIHSFKEDVTELFETLKNENFDCVVDLHRNLRSLRLKQVLGVKSYSFDKINLRKFFAVHLKMKNVLPPKHIVDRYFEAVEPLGVKKDKDGLDYFISKEDEINAAKEFFGGEKKAFTALVVGGSYLTKKIPLQKLEEICAKINSPVIALGDRSDTETAERLKQKFSNVINACGRYNLNQSASIISGARQVITSDTGLMHIAAAFKRKVISLWGNTIPEFGMSPYLPGEGSIILEVEELDCRPCSKLGFKKCPKGHFRCMMDIDIARIED